MTEPQNAIRHARCDCGQLSFEVQGPPVHVHACSCTQCQRSSGSVMSYSAWFPKDAVTVTGQFTKYQPHGKGHPERFSAFCPACGTGRFFTGGQAFPDTIAFNAGVFADPEFPAPEFIIYWADRPNWIGKPESVPLFEGEDEI